MLKPFLVLKRWIYVNLSFVLFQFVIAQIFWKSATYFMSSFLFYTPWKHWKTRGEMKSAKFWFFFFFFCTVKYPDDEGQETNWSKTFFPKSSLSPHFCWLWKVIVHPDFKVNSRSFTKICKLCFKVNNNVIKTTSFTSFWCLYC